MVCVVTSVNPFADLPYQRSCFEKWQKIGYQIFSCNHPEEAGMLLDGGFSQDEILLLADSDTTIHANGKYQPRINSLLRKAEMLTADEYIFVNSDISPAHDVVLSGVLKGIGASAAFCRMEVAEVDGELLLGTFYRGGLDVFYLSRPALMQIKALLAAAPNFNLLAMGVPGWDFILGSLIKRKLGGVICDAPVFHHRYHKVAYADISAFEPCTKDFAEILGSNNGDLSTLAAAFAKEIEETCGHHHSISRRLNLFMSRRYSLRRRTPTLDDLWQQKKVYDAREKSSDVSNKGSAAAQLFGLITEGCKRRDWDFVMSFLPKVDIGTPPLLSLLKALSVVLAEWKFERPLREIGYGANANSVPLQMIRKFRTEELEYFVANYFAKNILHFSEYDPAVFNFLVWSAPDLESIHALQDIKTALHVALRRAHD